MRSRLVLFVTCNIIGHIQADLVSLLAMLCSCSALPPQLPVLALRVYIVVAE